MERDSRSGRGVPSLLAEVEVANLACFDVVTPSPKDAAAAPSALLPPLSPNPGARRSEAVLPPLQAPGYRSMQPHSISLPASSSGFGPPPQPVPIAGGSHDLRRQAMLANATLQGTTTDEREPQQQNGKAVFRSQPIPGGQPPAARSDGRAMSRDRRYDSFKTFSGKLERQMTQPEEGDGGAIVDGHRPTSLPKVDRFFDALEGPELDKLKVLINGPFPFLYSVFFLFRKASKN
jgi:hypothetical protein